MMTTKTQLTNSAFLHLDKGNKIQAALVVSGQNVFDQEGSLWKLEM